MILNKCFMRLIALFLLFSLQLTPSFAKGKCQGKEVCLELSNLKNKTSEIKIYNTTRYPISIKIDFTPKDIFKDPAKASQTILLKPKETRKERLSFNNNSNNKSYRASYSWMHGDYRLNQSNYAYKFPYKTGTSRIVGQSFGGKESHNGRIHHAIDWNMKTGTEIYAARAGYVIKTEKRFTASGKSKHYLDKSNFIKILHDDGSFGVYAHLKHLGVKVKEGQRVNKGQLIGYSGNTGYSSGPHLHFHVAVPEFIDKGVTEKTIPFRFSNCHNNMFIPTTGKKYKSC